MENKVGKREKPLGVTLLSETACGIVAALSVTPFIAIVDKSIFSNASGREPMLQSLKSSVVEAVKRPSEFARQPAMRWIAFVYGSTYVVANCVEAVMNRLEYEPTSTGLGKFAATSATNIGASVLKDRAFSRLFGTGTVRHVPFASMALFGARDCITVAASFTLPPLVAPWLREQGVPAPDKAAQLLVPCAAQIFNTPLYLFGLSLYNHPEHSVSQRIAYLRAHYPSTLLARWARIFPAFGVGGILNKELRLWYQQHL